MNFNGKKFDYKKKKCVISRVKNNYKSSKYYTNVKRFFWD